MSPRTQRERGVSSALWRRWNAWFSRDSTRKAQLDTLSGDACACRSCTRLATPHSRSDATPTQSAPSSDAPQRLRSPSSSGPATKLSARPRIAASYTRSDVSSTEKPPSRRARGGR